MALFVVLCTDKPDSLDLRMGNRPAHLDYHNARLAKVKAGGPFLDDADRMVGSMLILDVADKAEAEAIVADDPYTLAGLFASVEIRPWRWGLNPPA